MYSCMQSIILTMYMNIVMSGLQCSCVLRSNTVAGAFTGDIFALVDGGREPIILNVCLVRFFLFHVLILQCSGYFTVF